MNPNQHVDTLKVALWAAIVALVLAVPPIWPYGYYSLLGLCVTAASIYALVVLRSSAPTHAVVLAFIALLFNPIVPVPLPKAMWAIESAKLCRANQGDARKAP